jgi:hypothetical protein
MCEVSYHYGDLSTSMQLSCQAVLGVTVVTISVRVSEKLCGVLAFHQLTCGTKENREKRNVNSASNCISNTEFSNAKYEY